MPSPQQQQHHQHQQHQQHQQHMQTVPPNNPGGAPVQHRDDGSSGYGSPDSETFETPIPQQ
jgi:hypothetical protein